MIASEFIAEAPEQIGIDPEGLQRLRDYVRSQVAAGLPSAQVAVGRRGQIAAVAGYGEVTRGGRSGPGRTGHPLLHLLLNQGDRRRRWPGR